MNKRTSILLVCIPTLMLLLVHNVLAQAAPTVEVAALPAHISEANEETTGPLSHTSDITFTPVATLYLPLVFHNYAPCTAVPTLLSPANGAALNNIIPLFRWDSGHDPRATEFNYEASKDLTFDYTYGFSSRYDAQGIHEDRLSWNFDPATLYYWRAYLMCGDVQGPYTAVWTFTTGFGGTLPPGPNLVSPADGASLAGTTVTLQWSTVAGAVEYNVYRKPAGSYAVYWTETGTEATLMGLDPNTTYEWWIKARSDYAWGTESAHRFFTTGSSSTAVISPTIANTCRSSRHAGSAGVGARSAINCEIEETRR